MHEKESFKPKGAVAFFVALALVYSLVFLTLYSILVSRGSTTP